MSSHFIPFKPTQGVTVTPTWRA